MIKRLAINLAMIGALVLPSATAIAAGETQSQVVNRVNAQCHTALTMAAQKAAANGAVAKGLTRAQTNCAAIATRIAARTATQRTNNFSRAAKVAQCRVALTKVAAKVATNNTKVAAAILRAESNCPAATP